jgi:hypothetical protein
MLTPLAENGPSHSGGRSDGRAVIPRAPRPAQAFEKAMQQLYTAPLAAWEIVADDDLDDDLYYHAPTSDSGAGPAEISTTPASISLTSQSGYRTSASLKASLAKAGS